MQQTSQATADSYFQPIQTSTVSPYQTQLDASLSQFTSDASAMIGQVSGGTSYLPSQLTPVVQQIAESTTNSESSSSSSSSTESSDTTDSSNSSDSESSSNSDTTDSSSSPPSIFDQGTNLAQYATNTTTSTLSGFYSQSGSSGQTQSTTSSSGSSGSGSSSGGTSSSGSTTGSSSSGGTSSTSSSNTSQSQTSSGNNDSGEDPSASDEDEEEAGWKWNPFEFPASSEADELQIPALGGGADLLSVRPNGTESFTTTTRINPTHSVAASFTKDPDTTEDQTDSTDDTEEDPSSKAQTDELTSDYTTELTINQEYTDENNWTITQTLTRNYQGSESGKNRRGTSLGTGRGISTTLTVVIVNGTSTSITYQATDSFTYTTGESRDDSKPGTGTTSPTVDTSQFSASLSFVATVSLSYSESLVTLPDGSPGVSRTFNFDTSQSGSFSVSGSYAYQSASGTLVSLPSGAPGTSNRPGPVGGGGSTPTIPGSINWLLPPPRDPNAIEPDPNDEDAGRNSVFDGNSPNAIQVGGNGHKIDAGGEFSLCGSAESSFFIHAAATSPAGQDIADEEITGNSGSSVSFGGSSSLSEHLDFDDQWSQGSAASDTDEYEYLSLAYANSGGGGSQVSTSMEVDLSEDLPDTSSSTTPGQLGVAALGTTTTLVNGSTPTSEASFVGAVEGSSEVLDPDAQQALNNSTSQQLIDDLPEGFKINVSTNSNSKNALGFSDVRKKRSYGAPGVVNTGIGGTGYSMSKVSEASGGLFSKDRKLSPNIHINYGVSFGMTSVKITEGETTTHEWTPFRTADEVISGRSELSNSFGVGVNFKADINSVIQPPDITFNFTLAFSNAYNTKHRLERTVTDNFGNVEYHRVYRFETEKSAVFAFSMTYDVIKGVTSDGHHQTHDVVFNYNMINGEDKSNPNSPPDDSDKPWDPVLDKVQFALDVVGMVPGFGEVADLANAGISAARGNYLEAGLSLAAMVPILGNGATATKLAKNGGSFFSKAGKQLAHQSDTVAKISDDVAAACGKANCFIAGTQVVTGGVDSVPRSVKPLETESLELLVAELPEESQATVIWIGLGLLAGTVRQVTKYRRRKPSSLAN